MVSPLAQILDVRILIKQILVTHQIVLKLRYRADIVQLHPYLHDILCESDGNILLALLGYLKEVPCKHLLEIPFADLGAYLRAKKEEQLPIIDAVGVREVLIQVLVHFRPALNIGDARQQVHYYINDLHLDAHVCFPKILEQAREILLAELLPLDQVQALVEEVETLLEGAPL